MSPRDLAIATALLALGAASARAAEPEPAGTIVSVTGPVSWHAEAETAFRPAQGGERLFPGAVVRTGERALARLRWRNGGDFELFALSELTVPEDEGVLLGAGKVWASFKAKLLAPFYFRSPSATAVVRGTILGVELLPDGGTTVSVEEGRVEVFGKGEASGRMLEPGQSILVSPFGGFGPLQPWRPTPGPLQSRAYRAPEPGRQAAGWSWLFGNRATARLDEARRVERERAGPDFGHRPEVRFEVRSDGPAAREAGRRVILREGGGPPPPPPEAGPGPTREIRVYPGERGSWVVREAGDPARAGAPPLATPERYFPAGRPQPAPLPPPSCEIPPGGTAADAPCYAEPAPPPPPRDR